MAAAEARWESLLTGKLTPGGQINKEQGQLVQVDQRETMGQKCGTGMMFTFRNVPRRQVQQRECVDSAWVASVHAWCVQPTADGDAKLLLDDKLAYYLRIVKKPDGTSQLRFTKRGNGPADPTIHYYFKRQ